MTERNFRFRGRASVSRTGSSARAGLTSFGVGLGRRADGVSRLAGVRAADAPLPLAFSLQHPSDSGRGLTGSLRPGVAGGNLVGLDSMASALWSQGAGGSLLLGWLVYAGYLRPSVIGDLFAMVGQFVIRVHLVGW